MERQEVHKSAKALENIVGLFYDYCQTLSAVSATQKKLSKSLKEAAQVKGTHNTPANAMAAAASIFEVLADVDTKFSRICEREYETISLELKKWFKKLAKEERTHDDLNFSINTRIRQATAPGSDKKTKKKERDLDVNLISSLGNDLAQAKVAHQTFITERHTAMLFSLGGCVTRLADAEWVRCCEEVRKVAPGVGRAGEWRAHCEGGWTYAIPSDLVDTTRLPPSRATSSTNLPASQSRASDPLNSDPGINGGPPSSAVINSTELEDGPLISPVPPFAAPAGSRSRSNSFQESTPRNEPRENQLLAPPLTSSNQASSRTSLSQSTPTASPSSPTVKFVIPAVNSTSDDTSASPTTLSSPSAPFPIRQDEQPATPHSYEEQLTSPQTSSHSQTIPDRSSAIELPQASNQGVAVPTSFARDPVGSSSTTQSAPIHPNPFRRSEQPGDSGSKEIVNPPPRPTSPVTDNIPDSSSNTKTRSVAFELTRGAPGTRQSYDRPLPDHTPSDRPRRPAVRSTSIDSTFSNGSVVAAMRDRYGGEKSIGTSPPPRGDLPRLQQSVTNLASRYASMDAPLRQAAPPSAFNDRYPYTRERYNSRYSYESDRERDREPDYFSPRDSREQDRDVTGSSQDWKDAREAEERQREANGRQRQDDTQGWRERETYRERESDRERDRAIALREHERVLHQRQQDLDREKEKIIWAREREYASDRDRDRVERDRHAPQRPRSPPQPSTPLQFQGEAPPIPTPLTSGRRHLSPPSSGLRPNSHTVNSSSTVSSHASTCGCYECSAKHYATPSPSLSASERERYLASNSTDRLASTSTASLTAHNSPALRPLKSPQVQAAVERERKSSGTGGWVGKGLRRLSMPIGAAFGSDKEQVSTPSSSIETGQRSLRAMPVVEEDRRARPYPTEGRSTMPAAVMRR